MKAKLACLALLAVSASVTPACCAIAGLDVNFTGQRNLIVWNPKTKTEHFIRKADFATKAKDMGFLAPSPTVPELVEVDEQVFDTVARMKPQDRSMGCAGEMADSVSSQPKAAVEVIGEQEVAGYQAAILKATDEKALQDWLQKNDYPAEDFVQDWLKHYVQKGWIITAFKVKRDAQSEASTGTVRMTFQTEAPFNPFLVPKENLQNPAQVEIFWISDSDYTGEVPGITDVQLKPEWTVPLVESGRKKIEQQLKLAPGSIPTGMMVSGYEPIAFRQVPDDLFFKRIPLAQIGPVTLPAAPGMTSGQTQTQLTQWLMLLAVGGGIALGMRRRARKAVLKSD